LRGGSCVAGGSVAGVGCGCAAAGAGVWAGVAGAGASVVCGGGGNVGLGDGGGVVTVTGPGEGSGRCGVGVTPGCDVCGRGSVGRAGCGCDGRVLVVDSCGFGAISGGPRSGGVAVGAGNEGLGTDGAIGVSAGTGAKATRDAVSDQRLKPAIASAITTTAPTPAQIHDRVCADADPVAGVVVDRCSAAGVTCVRVAAASEPDSRSRRMRLSSASRSDAC